MNKIKMYAVTAWVIAAILLGATWANTSNTTSISVTPSGVGTENLLASVTGQTDEVILYTYKEGNRCYITEDAVGTVYTRDDDDDDIAGEIYEIQVADTGRYRVTIFLTNIDELVKAYSYLNLEITAVDSGNNTEDSAWLTLSNGQIILYVDGDTNKTYHIKVTDGVFYCIDANPGEGGSLTPQFYCIVEQA